MAHNIFHPPQVPHVNVGATNAGRQPYGPSQLPPSLLNNQVDQPPVAHVERRVPVDALLVAIGQADPNNYAPWSYAALTGSDRQPYGKRLLHPSALNNIVNTPPFAHSERQVADAAAITAIGQPDPFNYTPWSYAHRGGDKQFYGKNLLNPQTLRVDNPPFRFPERTPAAIAVVQQQQPDPWVFNLIRGAPYGAYQQTPPTFTLPVDNPPNIQEALAIAAQLVSVWQPDPWTYAFGGSSQPYNYSKLPPSALNNRVDQPPFIQESMAVTAELIAIWQPDPWQYTFQGASQPYAPARLNPSVTANRVDNPPFAHQGRAPSTAQIAATWQPDPWAWVFNNSRQPYDFSKIAATRLADAPPRIQTWLATQAQIIAMAQPEWPHTFTGASQAYQQRRLPLSVTANRVDQPPRIRRDLEARAAIIAQNQPELWSYTYGWRQPYDFGRRLNPNVLRIDNPPFQYAGPYALRAEIVGLHQPGAPAVTLPRYTIPTSGITPVVTAGGITITGFALGLGISDMRHTS